MSLKVVGIVQARMASERLPGKVLAPLLPGKSLLEVLIARLQRCGIEWWIATSDSEEDDVIERVGRIAGLNVFRGSKSNVLDRFVGILRKTQPDWFARVTADNPFTSGKFLVDMLGLLDSLPTSCNHVGGHKSYPGYPLGFTPELVRASEIWSIYERLDKIPSFHLSHVTSAIQDEARHRLKPSRSLARENWRWTVDYKEDLRMAQLAFGVFGEEWLEIGYEDMVRALDLRPDIVTINSRFSQKLPEEG